MSKKVKLLSLVLICVMLLTAFAGQVVTVGATQSNIVSSELTASDFSLCGTFNDWDGQSMYYVDDTVVSAEICLEAGNYSFNIKDSETVYGHSGTIKDTTVYTAENGFNMSEGVNTACTLVATGGTYTFLFDTATLKLKVYYGDIQDAEPSEGSELTVNISTDSKTASVGDTLTYEVYLSAEKLLENVQVAISYDDEKLRLEASASADEQALESCPNLTGVIYCCDNLGIVSFNSSDIEGYDFTEEKLLTTLRFTVIGAGETTLDLTVQEMTATDSTTYYTYSNQVLGEGTAVSEVLTVSEAPAQLAFAGASITLQDNIMINFKVNETLFTESGYINPYAVFEMNGTKSIVSAYRILDGKYIFDFADISPANLNDTVYATLYASYNGTEFGSKTIEYSVATYCYNSLARYSDDSYHEFRTLLVDLLNYGATSQIYEDYRIDALVNARLTDEQAAWGTSEAPVYESALNTKYETIENPSVEFLSAGLNLENSVTMRFKISTESTDGLTARIKTDKLTWTISADDFLQVSDGWYIFFNGLNAGQMSEIVYVTIYDGNTAVSNTITYSIETYAYSKQSSTDENLVNLLEAMIKYGDAAYAYITE